MSGMRGACTPRLFSAVGQESSPVAVGPQADLVPGPSSEEPPLDLTGKVYQLEVMLKQLHTDLQKEKQDKVVLQSEVASLRQNNQRLQEESQAASEQLRKFAEIFCREKKEL
ncbi:signal-induced proliferation-associated 1-like protein 3 [Saguinus oedipus]|uniref:Signal-induced proliferation-associated 1-like protein 3 n=1 Tax=Saguinus oedipus TaxID=9490 RepID=A0ABQ9TUZ3_SAGOE|nr:signal-induced proliferation-associated 1-like protein 3 [Saguinus oedipus]